MRSTKGIKELVDARRSVRTFDGKGLSSEELQTLKDIAAECSSPYGIPIEFRFLSAKADGLKSVVIAGADDFIGMKVKKADHFEEAVGYAFERFVLEAISMGIGTTWIGGTMDRAAFERAMELGDDEIMPCISPLGHPAKRMSIKEVAMRKGVGADKRVPFEKLFFDGDFDTPLTKDKAGKLAFPLEMVQWGPSAVNKQPWRVVVKDDYAHFYKQSGKGFKSESSGDMQRIDMGIALFHFEEAARELGVDVKFEIDDPVISMPEGVEYIASYKIF